MAQIKLLAILIVVTVAAITAALAVALSQSGSDAVQLCVQSLLLSN